MKHHPLSVLAGFAAGMIAMFYLDAANGARRRALVRDKLVRAGHQLSDLAEAQGKHIANRAKGIAATHRLDRKSHRAPQSDAQLHDRIRAHLGRVVSHPGSIHVDVQGGCVCLRGDVLTREQEVLCREVQDMAGVREVRNEMQAHDSPEGVPGLQGRQTPRGREQRPSTTWH